MGQKILSAKRHRVQDKPHEYLAKPIYLITCFLVLGVFSRTEPGSNNRYKNRIIQYQHYRMTTLSGFFSNELFPARAKLIWWIESSHQVKLVTNELGEASVSQLAFFNSILTVICRLGLSEFFNQVLSFIF